MILKTERLLLRPWTPEDAENLFTYAKDPDVGPIAGWPAHQSPEESKAVIETVFCGAECYAVCLKDNQAIGTIELKLNGHTDMTDKDDECELGYWIGKPFWGNGYIPEAVREMLRHAFEDLSMSTVWCGYFDGNQKSKRVQEKCGFAYHHTTENIDVPLMHEVRTGHVNVMTKAHWQKQKPAPRIRRAEEKDIPRILELLVQVNMVHHLGRPDLFNGSATKYTKAELLPILSDEKTPVFAAVDETDTVLGYAFCIFKQYLNDNILTDIKTLYIDDLCVDETIRGKHIGKTLYDHVLAFAKANGCYNVTLNVWTCNASAMRFYEKCGLKPQKIGMEAIL